MAWLRGRYLDTYFLPSGCLAAISSVLNLPDTHLEPEYNT